MSLFISYYYSRFQKACVKYGVPDVDLFQAVDLMERKNIAQVTNTIFAIGRAVIIVHRYNFFFVKINMQAENNYGIILIRRRIDIHDGRALGWDQDQLKKINDTSQRNN